MSSPPLSVPPVREFQAPQDGQSEDEARKIVIKVYLSPDEFYQFAKDAEQAGFRRGGLPLWIKKPHGFANERLANTDGISKFFKWTARNHGIVQALRAALASLLASGKRVAP